MPRVVKGVGRATKPGPSSCLVLIRPSYYVLACPTVYVLAMLWQAQRLPRLHWRNLRHSAAGDRPLPSQSQSPRAYSAFACAGFAGCVVAVMLPRIFWDLTTSSRQSSRLRMVELMQACGGRVCVCVRGCAWCVRA